MPSPPTRHTDVDPVGVATRAIALMAGGTLAELSTTIHPDAHNREAATEPPASRGRGPDAFHATALWLRQAFAELHWDVLDAVAQPAPGGALVVLHTAMSGRQTGPFVVHDADGLPAQVFPATGRAFSVTQTHWQRVVDGLVIEHWANRDDLGMAQQLGWNPPPLPYLVRMATATRAARRTARRRQEHLPVLGPG